jgi:predicted amidohydrolase
MSKEQEMGRRGFVLGAPAVGGLMAAGIGSAGAAEPAAGPGARPAPPRRPDQKVTVAALRVPVIVPPSPEGLAAARTKNAEIMVDEIEKLMKGPGPKPQLIVFGVLALTSANRAASGLPISGVAVDLEAEPLQKSVFAPVVAACKRHNCYVSTSTQEKSAKMPGKFFHTGFIIGPNGLVLRSPKTQAPSAPEMFYIRDVAEDYKKVFGPDSIMPVVKTPIGTLACYVEGEAEVLEVSRNLAHKGADIIVHTSLEGDDIPWLAIKQAIGYQTHTFLVTGTSSRFIGPKPGEILQRAGSSTVIGPTGKVLAQKGGTEEGAAIAEINLADIDDAKAKYSRTTTPAWNLYTDLYKK